MASSKTWKGPVFGSQSVRFSGNGLHPNLLTTGRMPYDIKSAANVGPGSYNLEKYNEFSEANVNKRAEGPNWEKSFLTEKMAKIPHLLYIEEYQKKIEQSKKLGPGYYDSITVKDKPQSKVGLIGALSERFPKNELNSYPGPGSYGIPDEAIEEKRKNKPGKVQLLDRSKGERSLPTVGSEVPPGVYNMKSSIDELLKKKVSTRGPYDVFTENRSGPVKTGFYVKDLNYKLGPGEYQHKSTIDDLNDSAHVKHGKFGKIAQYPTISGDRLSIALSSSLQPRNPDWPGPGHYNPSDKLSSFPVNTPAFLSTSSRNDRRSQKFFNRNFNAVGVGRYDIGEINKIDSQNGHKSVFNSKTPQITDKKRESLLKERLRPCNLDHIEKRNIYLTGHVNGDALARSA